MMIRRRISGYDIWTFEFISYYTVRGMLRRMTPDCHAVQSLSFVYTSILIFTFILPYFSIDAFFKYFPHFSLMLYWHTYLFISSPFQQKLNSRLSSSGQLCHIVGYAVRT
jgi:hypothetical protein